MIGHRFDSNTPIAETVGVIYGYFFPQKLNHRNRCKHSTTLSKLDMCDTSACHLAGLGSVSVKAFCCFHLIPYISSSPHDAKYSSPLYTGPFDNPIALGIFQITPLRTS